MPIPENATLYDLIEIGITHTHAAVSVVVRLRQELSHVKDIPVLIAIDQVSRVSSALHVEYVFAVIFGLDKNDEL